MPLPDPRRVVAILLQQQRHRQLVRLDQRRRISLQHPALQSRPPVIPARQNPVPRRGAHRRTPVRIREHHPLRRQPVHMRRRDLPLRVQALHIPVAQIIRQYVDDVRFRPLRRHHPYGRQGQQQDRQFQPKTVHDHGNKDVCPTDQVSTMSPVLGDWFSPTLADSPPTPYRTNVQGAPCGHRFLPGQFREPKCPCLIHPLIRAASGPFVVK